jgi:hypothetical protein
VWCDRLGGGAQDADKPSTSGQDDMDGKSNDAWRKAASEVTRIHNQRNPDQPMAISGEELAKVIRSAATGALDLLQQSLKPNFCKRLEAPCSLETSSADSASLCVCWLHLCLSEGRLARR